ncbi:MAG: hypothetical protein WBD16_15125 [Pyrinomonadaceae bacterium]
MRIVILSLILAAMSAVTFAQDTPRPAQKGDEPHVAKILAQMYVKHGAIENSPFTADEENESVQTLADGNRIVRKSTGKIYRNSEGRVRREVKGGQGGMLGTTFSVGGGTWIENPALGHKMMLDDAMKTAKIVRIEDGKITINGKPAAPGDPDVKIVEKISKVTSDGKNTTEAVVVENNNGVVTRRPMTDEEKATIKEKMKTAKPGDSLKEFVVDSNVVTINGGSGGVGSGVSGRNVGTVITRSVGGQSVGGLTFTTDSSKYESKTEELGTRDFEGVPATGTRKITTIPAGAIGNERPIEIVYERWYSKELGMTVYSKNIDPRFGEQTYRLLNISRSEPDPSLFTVPQGYKTITTKGGDVNVSTPGVYRITTTKSDAEKAVSKPNQQ